MTSLLGTTLAALASLTACGGSGQATFTGKSDLQLERTMSAATGGDAAIALTFAFGYALVPTGTASCPAVTTSGANLDVTGGCTTDDGSRVDGTATITNAAGLFGSASASQSGSLAFDQFSLTGSGSPPLALDGSVTFATGTMTTDLEASFGGVGAHTDMSVACGSNGTCTIGDGATIDVDGVGQATVTGSWSSDQSTLAVTVTGDETLSITRANDCLDYTIAGGASGRFCNSN